MKYIFKAVNDTYNDITKYLTDSVNKIKQYLIIF